MDDALNLTQYSIQIVYNFWNNDKLEEETVANIDSIIGQMTLITIFIIQLMYENPEIELNPSLFNINAFLWCLAEVHYQIFEKSYIYFGESINCRPFSILVQNLVQDIIGLVMIKDTDNSFGEFGLPQLVLVFFIIITILDTFSMIKLIYTCFKGGKFEEKIISRGGLKYYLFGITVGYMSSIGLYTYVGLLRYQDFSLKQTDSFWLQISTIITLEVSAIIQYSCFCHKDTPNATTSKKLYSLILGFSSGLLCFYTAIFWLLSILILCYACCGGGSSDQVIPVEFNQYYQPNIFQNNNISDIIGQQIERVAVEQQIMGIIERVPQIKDSQDNEIQPEKSEQKSEQKSNDNQEDSQTNN